MSSGGKKRICIIGGGQAGLVASKQCLEEGLEVTCYERTSSFGGLWVYRPDETEEVASVAKSTIINTSKELTAYSDFPPPNEFANFMHNTQMLKYLQLYAEKFGLSPYIKLNHKVLQVTFNDDYDVTGKWKVTVEHNSETTTEVFDGVLVCTGHHVNPLMPAFKGQDKFKGKILHSHSYKVPAGFEDKVGVVVGIGNSAGDAAAELAAVCSTVYLSTRRGAWVRPRRAEGGRPADLTYTTRMYDLLGSILPLSWVNEYITRVLNNTFDHQLYRLKPKHLPMQQHPTINDVLPHCILNGMVVVKRDIVEFTEDGVIFEGSEREFKCDFVVFGTGYEIAFPFFDPSILTANHNKLPLFKNVFQPRLRHPHTLACIGLVQPLGPIMPVSELQSRWFALLMTGKCKLPSKESMVEIMEKDIKTREAIFYESPRHSLEVPFLSYLDTIASYIGAKPCLYRLALFDPKLWWALFFGPVLSYQYRLVGPHKWSGARDAILNVEKRMSAPFNTLDK